MRNTIKSSIPPAITFIAILAIWEAAVRLKDVPLYILPPPSKIAAAFTSDFGQLLTHSITTLEETIIGLLLATALAMAVALFMDASGAFRSAVYPLLVVSQAIPIIVLAPIFIIYLGFGIAPKVLTVLLMCFFPIVISFADGMARTDPRLINLARAYGAGPLRVYALIKIPGAADALISGLKVAATYSVVGAVVGEWLSSDSGLGYYMLRVKNGYMLDKVFASVLAVVLLSLLMNGAVRLIRWRALPWLRVKK